MRAQLCSAAKISIKIERGAVDRRISTAPLTSVHSGCQTGSKDLSVLKLVVVNITAESQPSTDKVFSLFTRAGALCNVEC